MTAEDKDGEEYYTPKSDGTPFGDAQILLPSRHLFDPFAGDVWGLFYDNSDPGSPVPAVTAERQYPIAAHLMLNGVSFWVMPSVYLPADDPDDKESKDEKATLKAAGVQPDDIPLAMFSGLVGQKVTGHKTYDRVIQQAIGMMAKAYEKAMKSDYYGIVSDAANAKKDRDPNCPDCQGWGIAIDERVVHLYPSPALYDAAIARMREAHDKRTSFADALTDIRDSMVTDPQVGHRFDLLIKEHRANEFLAQYAVNGGHAGNVNSPELKSFALKNGITIDDAKATILSRAGAAAPAHASSGGASRRPRVMRHRFVAVGKRHNAVAYIIGGAAILGGLAYFLRRRS